MAHRNIYLRIALTLIPVCFLSVSCNRNNQEDYPELRKAISEMHIIDTHEHFGPESERSAQPLDFFSLAIGYLQADMVSSGMSDAELAFMLDNKNPSDERWKIFNTYWSNVNNTGYGKCFSATVSDLFGITTLNERAFAVADSSMKASNTQEGWYKYILKDKSRIDVSIIDPLGKNAENVTDYPADYFVRVRRFDNFVRVNRNFISGLEDRYSMKIKSLSDYLTALDMAFERGINEGIIGIKSGLAYSRILYFEDVSREKAEILFAKFMQPDKNLNAVEKKSIDDFMMHQVAERAEKYDLPFQIHTGILSRNFNNSNPIENTNAIHLSNLFLKYRKLKFVIFHGSYPYMAELSYLAKHYPNVYIDMCWMYIISPLASKTYLEEWLLTVPSNKIMGFGGDVTVEWAIGHASMAREIINEVLVKMIKEGNFSEEEAIEIAKKLLRENALNLYKLENVDGKWRKRHHISIL